MLLDICLNERQGNDSVPRAPPRCIEWKIDAKTVFPAHVALEGIIVGTPRGNAMCRLQLALPMTVLVLAHQFSPQALTLRHQGPDPSHLCGTAGELVPLSYMQNAFYPCQG